MAEGEGFEPPVPCGTAIFKTAALNHSATLPNEKRNAMIEKKMRNFKRITPQFRVA